MEQIATNRQVDFIVDHSYANTGVMMFQHQGEFKPLVKFTFAFQPEYASFDGIPNPKRALEHDPDMWHHVTPNEMDDFVQAIQVALVDVGVTVKARKLGEA